MKRTSIRDLSSLILFFFFVLFFNYGQACEVNLNWTAPGDDGMIGTVSQYDIRYSEFIITNNNWDSAQPVIFNQEILPAGSQQQILIEGLVSGKTYYFALKSCDEVSNWAPMSNVVPKVAGRENCTGVTGNINCDVDELVTISDLTTLIDYLFVRGELGCCAGEANIFEPSNPMINIMDLTAFIQYYYYENFPLTVCY